MKIYRLTWEEISERAGKPREYVVHFRAADDSAAVTESNRRLPGVAINAKLYNIGTEVSLT